MYHHWLTSFQLIGLARSRTVNGARAAAQPLLRQRLAQSVIEVELLKLQNWRTLTHLLRHGKPGPESSLVKLFWSEMSQRLHDTAMEILGVDGLLMKGDARAVAHGRWSRSYLYYRAGTIFAGTSEIQRNIIAERVLGLPRSR